MRTDRRTAKTKLIVAFRNFANAPINSHATVTCVKVTNRHLAAVHTGFSHRQSVRPSRAHVKRLTLLYSPSSISGRLTLQVQEGVDQYYHPPHSPVTLLVFHKGLKAMEWIFPTLTPPSRALKVTPMWYYFYVHSPSNARHYCYGNRRKNSVLKRRHKLAQFHLRIASNSKKKCDVKQ